MDVFFNEVHLRDWSTERQIIFYELTRRLLDQFRDSTMVDAITVVQGYEQLVNLYPGSADYCQAFRESMFRLVSLLEMKGETTAAERLRSIATAEP